MRCVTCKRVVRHPAKHSKKLRMCGICRKQEGTREGEQILFIISHGRSST
jgi:RNA polymerase subunit RPABC4/transcription elongation factor Spt4